MIARKNGKNWYLAGLTDWNARSIEVKLNFLEADKYKMEVFKDGVNADVYASDFKTEEVIVSKVIRSMSQWPKAVVGQQF